MKFRTHIFPLLLLVCAFVLYAAGKILSIEKPTSTNNIGNDKQNNESIYRIENQKSSPKSSTEFKNLSK